MVKLFALAAVAGQAARVSPHVEQSGKVIAGIPVVNYDLAYEGRGYRSSADEQQQWVIFGKQGYETSELERICESSGSCEGAGDPSAGGVPYIEVRATEEKLEKVLSQNPDLFDYIEPDGKWHLGPEEMVELQAASWGLDKVGVPSAAYKGAGSNVYILDTGIRVTHQDFGGRAMPAADVTSGKLVACSESPTNSACAADKNGHGTHCAGSAAGTTFGVAPRAQVRSIKVLSDSGGGSFSWCYAALDFLAKSGKRPTVASMSLGGSGQLSGIKTSIDAAVSAGVTVVVAAGNENQNACNFSPAYVPNAITVGSTDSLDRRSSFSNFGSCTNIWAPGSRITSASHTSDTGSTAMSGTSMACPHVAGAAALVQQETKGVSPAGVLSTLRTRSKKNLISDLKTGDSNMLLWVGR